MNIKISRAAVGWFCEHMKGARIRHLIGDTWFDAMVVEAHKDSVGSINGITVCPTDSDGRPRPSDGFVVSLDAMIEVL